MLALVPGRAPAAALAPEPEPEPVGMMLAGIANPRLHLFPDDAARKAVVQTALIALDPDGVPWLALEGNWIPQELIDHPEYIAYLKSFVPRLRQGQGNLPLEMNLYPSDAQTFDTQFYDWVIQTFAGWLDEQTVNGRPVERPPGVPAYTRANYPIASVVVKHTGSAPGWRSEPDSDERNEYDTLMDHWFYNCGRRDEAGSEDMRWLRIPPMQVFPDWANGRGGAVDHQQSALLAIKRAYWDDPYAAVDGLFQGETTVNWRRGRVGIYSGRTYSNMNIIQGLSLTNPSLEHIVPVQRVIAVWEQYRLAMMNRGQRPGYDSFSLRALVSRVTGDPFNWTLAMAGTNAWRSSRGLACWAIRPQADELRQAQADALTLVNGLQSRRAQMLVPPQDWLTAPPDMELDLVEVVPAMRQHVALAQIYMALTYHHVASVFGGMERDSRDGHGFVWYTLQDAVDRVLEPMASNAASWPKLAFARYTVLLVESTFVYKLRACGELLYWAIGVGEIPEADRQFVLRQQRACSKLIDAYTAAYPDNDEALRARYPQGWRNWLVVATRAERLAFLRTNVIVRQLLYEIFDWPFDQFITDDHCRTVLAHVDRQLAGFGHTSERTAAPPS